MVWIWPNCIKYSEVFVKYCRVQPRGGCELKYAGMSTLTKAVEVFSRVAAVN